MGKPFCNENEIQLYNNMFNNESILKGMSRFTEEIMKVFESDTNLFAVLTPGRIRGRASYHSWLPNWEGRRGQDQQTTLIIQSCRPQ